MKKIPSCAAIPLPLLNKLALIPANERPDRWDAGRLVAVKEFKAKVKDQGLANQGGSCAWCSLKLGDGWSRTCHRDHIAPKALYNQWTFLPENIALACENCNGFAKKGATDTISKLDANYYACEFTIIHPYFDEPDQHLRYIGCDRGLPVIVQKITDKGLRTIELFGLDDPDKTKARTSELLYAAWQNELTPDQNQLVRDAMAKPSA